MSDGQWSRLQPLLPNKPRGVPRVDDRRVISGIVHVLQSGCRWKDAPAIYGPPETLYNRNVRWAAKGVWRAVFETLAAAGGLPTAGAHRQHAFEGAPLGGRRKRGACFQAIGVSRGGRNTKPVLSLSKGSTPSPIARADRSPSC